MQGRGDMMLTLGHGCVGSRACVHGLPLLGSFTDLPKPEALALPLCSLTLSLPLLPQKCPQVLYLAGA